MRDIGRGLFWLALVVIVGLCFLVILGLTRAVNWMVMRINRKFDQLFGDLW